MWRSKTTSPSAFHPARMMMLSCSHPAMAKLADAVAFLTI
jgi:hypothetical protein